MNKLYLILIMLLFLAQMLFTLNSLNQIRYEELAESIRNPFWIQNGYIYDGTSSNVGWYGLLAIIYKIFGFSVFSAKFVRLGLQLVSLICLAALLKKYLGLQKAWLPLITIGLSPTLLYFNVLQTSYGMDLQFIPICLFILSNISFKKGFSGIFLQIILWVVVMFAWLSYPTFIFYIPGIFAIYIYKLIGFKKKPLKAVKYILISLISFLAPIFLFFLYVKNREWLIYDPNTHSGLLRGGGVLQINSQTFLNNTAILALDLFSRANGYNFELSKVDFSNLFPVFTLITLCFLTFKMLLTQKKLRLVVLASLTTLLFSFFVSSLFADTTNNIRRYTPILASIYALYAISFLYISSLKNKLIKWIYIAFLVLLPLHHLLVYPSNLSSLKNPSLYRDSSWFAQAKTPDKSLNLFLDQVKKKDLSLACMDSQSRYINCRYNEIYAAIAGACYWNNLTCHRILGYDSKTKDFLPLSINLWNNYYLGH